MGKVVSALSIPAYPFRCRPLFYRLQQAPTGTVQVKLRPDKKAFPVSLSPETLTFDESNWNVAQFVTIDAGELGSWMVAGKQII